jgi:hypothetical protein
LSIEDLTIVFWQTSRFWTFSKIEFYPCPSPSSLLIYSYESSRGDTEKTKQRSFS